MGGKCKVRQAGGNGRSSMLMSPRPPLAYVHAAENQPLLPTSEWKAVRHKMKGDQEASDRHKGERKKATRATWAHIGSWALTGSPGPHRQPRFEGSAALFNGSGDAAFRGAHDWNRHQCHKRNFLSPRAKSLSMLKS